MSLPSLLIPDWPAPPGVGAAMSTRHGGVSLPPFDSWNLRPSTWDAPSARPPIGDGAGAAAPSTDSAAADCAQAVAENLRRYADALGARPVILRQVHGTAVLDLDCQDSPADRPAMADAAVTTQFGLACTVLVADCLPVLLTDQNGRAVAAAHAGWRGLAAGILENTVRALCRAADCTAAQVLAWLGPCIGPEAFEVGPDVLQAFGVATDGGEAKSSIMGTRSKSGVGGLNLTTEAAKAFSYAPRPDGTPRWRADLAQLACQRLGSVGVHRVTASGLCTAGDASRFFSFRRDGLTGRMAASIWRRA